MEGVGMGKVKALNCVGPWSLATQKVSADQHPLGAVCLHRSVGTRSPSDTPYFGAGLSLSPSSLSTSCVPLPKLLYFSEPQFPHLLNELG
jgi:hypothetical protein